MPGPAKSGRYAFIKGKRLLPIPNILQQKRTGFLTNCGRNAKKNAVSLSTSEGVQVSAERSKDGTLKSFEIIDESGEEKKEIRKSMEDGRASYEVSFGGQTMLISEDVNGTLVFEAG